MTRSMTAFAAAKGSSPTHSWAWELRSVNAKGLDIRLRIPEWIEGLEAGLRARLGKALARGSVGLTLRVTREEGEAVQKVNAAALDAALEAVQRVEARAAEKGLSLSHTRAVDLLGLRGVMETAAPEDEAASLRKALLADFEPLLAAFIEMREAEGRALNAILLDQLDQIATLTEAAAGMADARRNDRTLGFHYGDSSNLGSPV